jgi:hypothetical protein
MAILTGGGEYVYEVVENWGKLPDGWNYDVAGVGIDSKNRIFLFNRSERPMIIVDVDGKVLHSWGDKKTFPNAHAVTMGPDGTIWLTDTFDHTVSPRSR